ncbi:lymphocyte antigen 75 [Megalops cyprinoides]|uniref:lymphocyte antigen 75 n=1 Tax=Megalops cyprinoides TaxID=118141 RepID=UPI001863AAE5|nr:lymphocyte antigen 75 [Megalops cyprinoides]
MDGGTKDITERYIYMCAFLLVGLTAIHSGNCALTQNSGEDIFTIRHVSVGQCLQAEPQGVRVGACRGAPAEQWKWGWGNRLFHVDTARCLGLQPNAVTPTLLSCNSSGDMLSWHCEEEAVYIRSELYLSAANGTVAVQKDRAPEGWTRGNSSECICHRPYKVVHTTKGNSFGEPCVFPFLYDGTWFHGCFPDELDENYTRCSTTSDYDTDRKWGICLNYEEGCGPLWSPSDSGNCYQSNTEAMVSWHEARASCWSQGADLLSVSSPAELAPVNVTDHPRLMWIGLNQLNMAQGWQWSDGSPLTLAYWNKGMTEVSALTESDCAAVTPEGRWEKTACDRKLPYICEKAASRTQPENPWVLKATKCPAGWFAWNGFCYQLSKEPQSQADTVFRCGKDKALLASIASLAEVEAISTEFHNSTVGVFDVWIGLMSQKSPPLFQWMDNTSVSFTYWARNEPTAPSESSSTCVSYSGKFHQWKVTPCGNKLRYLCKKRGQDLGTVVRAGCPSDGDWVRHGNACYKVDTKPVLFKDRCDLTIMNRFEQAFISSLIREKRETQYYWTGLQDINNTGEYHWSTREIPIDRVTYTNWAPNEPGRGGQCAVMSSGKLGQWELKDCTLFRAGSVCKKEIGPHTAPEPEPDLSAPCPSGWDSKPDLHYCYKVFHEERLSRKRSWEEAERFCEALGAHLPSFTEQDEFSSLHGILRDKISSDRFFWVGLNRRNPILDGESPWEWSDGRPVSTFLLHNIHEDDEYNRDCLALKVVKWRRYPSLLISLLHGYTEQAYLATPFTCDAQLEWVCQIPRGSTPLTPTWFNPHGHHESSIFVDGKEFWFVNETALSHEEAELYCSSNDSKLAEPRSFSTVRQIHDKLAQLSSGRMSWWVNIEDMRNLYPWSMRGMYYHYYQSRFLDRCSALSSTSIMPDYPYSCGQRLPFVCEKINVTSVEKDPRPHPKGLPCKEGELAFKDKCYMVRTRRYLRFDKANEHCMKDGGSLLTISSQIEQDFISSLSDQPNKSWIGLRSSNQEWEWVDDSPVTFSNFNPLLHGQLRLMPVNILDPDHMALCVFMYHGPNAAMMGSWDFSSCQDEQYVSVCQRYADKPEEPWVPEGRFQVKEHTYKILQKSMTWFMARDECGKEDMDLASISDIYQQVNLSVTASRFNGSLWIGLFSEDDGIHYRWTDQTHTSFSRWYPEPTSGRCVYLDTDGFWKATDCEEELPGAICHVPRDDHAELPPEHSKVKCPHKANGPNWIPFGSHCYTFQLAASRWDSYAKNVRETCKNLDPDAEILTIRNETENEFVRQQFQHFKDLADFVWVGVFNDSTDNKLKWYDGTYVQYSNWKDGRPNVTDSFMAGLNAEGLWELVKNQRYYARFRQLTIVACKLDYDSKEDFSKNVHDYKEYGNLNYSVIQEKLTWYEALRKCGTRGGHLASVHDMQQDAHLELLAKTDGFPLWIGLSSQDDRGSPREWSDGTVFDYKPAAYTHSDPEGNCILVNTRGAWERRNCSSVQEGAICYHNTTPRSSPQSSPASGNCPQGMGTSKWIQYKDHCYAFDMTFYNYSVFTMEDAKAVCGRLDTSSQLLTIKDRDENSFVSRYVTEDPLITSRVWLGLDLEKKGKWVDGSTVDFDNWDASSVKDTGLGCAAMISANGGVWSRVSCSQSRSRIVCKAPVRSRGTSVALAFFLITVVTLLAAAAFVIYKKNRSRFTSTIRYQRNFDECDTTSIITDTE